MSFLSRQEGSLNLSEGTCRCCLHGTRAKLKRMSVSIVSLLQRQKQYSMIRWPRHSLTLITRKVKSGTSKLDTRSDKGRLLIVSYTERQERIRIISCRPATRKEWRDYEER